jgi:hypothetical protein
MVTRILPNLYDAGVKSRKMPYLAMFETLRLMVGGSNPNYTSVSFYRLLDNVWRNDTIRVPVYAEDLKDSREVDWKMFSFVWAFWAFDEFLKTEKLHDDVIAVIESYRPYVLKETQTDSVKPKSEVDVRAVVELLRSLGDDLAVFQHAANIFYDHAGAVEKIKRELGDLLESERDSWLRARQDETNLSLARERLIALQEQIIHLNREIKERKGELTILMQEIENLKGEKEYLRRSTATLRTQLDKLNTATED